MQSRASRAPIPSLQRRRSPSTPFTRGGILARHAQVDVLRALLASKTDQYWHVVHKAALAHVGTVHASRSALSTVRFTAVRSPHYGSRARDRHCRGAAERTPEPQLGPRTIPISAGLHTASTNIGKTDTGAAPERTPKTQRLRRLKPVPELDVHNGQERDVCLDSGAPVVQTPTIVADRDARVSRVGFALIPAIELPGRDRSAHGAGDVKQAQPRLALVRWGDEENWRGGRRTEAEECCVAQFLSNVSGKA
ncbi:hypothetical protein EJ06DRAFT_523870 [Trichodelitschia bisporula]|uniref:Uncharacterized protein n=1 Tax=Trichodelitschia bisporula TaxID=703511 RepID=A0A6G1HNF8_9PEZI|nr:hypothetical protein EJ06DRAFT_523870 [Trichodelitschia bisporula]